MQGAIALRVRFSCVLSKSPYCCAHKMLHMLLCDEKFEPYWTHLVLTLLLDSVVVLLSLALAKSNFHAIILVACYNFLVITINVRFGQYRFGSDSFGPIR